jgi:hypothetical protein
MKMYRVPAFGLCREIEPDSSSDPTHKRLLKMVNSILQTLPLSQFRARRAEAIPRILRRWRPAGTRIVRPPSCPLRPFLATATPVPDHLNCFFLFIVTINWLKTTASVLQYDGYSTQTSDSVPNGYPRIPIYPTLKLRHISDIPSSL